MRKPYGTFLIVSILLTILYFIMEERPAYISYSDDQDNVLFFGVIYVVLLFGTMSVIYLYFKKNSPGK